MESTKSRTCQFCRYIWTSNCPFESIKNKGDNSRRDIEDDACGQFSAVLSGKEFKKRLAMKEQEIKEVKSKAKKIRGQKRSLDF